MNRLDVRVRPVEPSSVEGWCEATQLLDGPEDCGAQGRLSPRSLWQSHSRREA